MDTTLSISLKEEEKGGGGHWWLLTVSLLSLRGPVWLPVGAGIANCTSSHLRWAVPERGSPTAEAPQGVQSPLGDACPPEGLFWQGLHFCP